MHCTDVTLPKTFMLLIHIQTPVRDSCLLGAIKVQRLAKENFSMWTVAAGI